MFFICNNEDDVEIPYITEDNIFHIFIDYFSNDKKKDDIICLIKLFLLNKKDIYNIIVKYHSELIAIQDILIEYFYLIIYIIYCNLNLFKNLKNEYFKEIIFKKLLIYNNPIYLKILDKYLNIYEYNNPNFNFILHLVNFISDNFLQFKELFFKNKNDYKKIAEQFTKRIKLCLKIVLYDKDFADFNENKIQFDQTLIQQYYIQPIIEKTNNPKIRNKQVGIKNKLDYENYFLFTLYKMIEYSIYFPITS